MPRNAARSFDSRTGPGQSTSFSHSASSESSSYLSSRNKALSPKSNFNPFSPLSPDPPEQELEDLDDDGALFAMEGIPSSRLRTYTRKQLLDIAHHNQTGWTKPAGMGSLESWFGKVQHTSHDDPAIASIGFAPNRRGGGYGEGFGYGGGIGGKGLNRGGRHAGARRHDQGHSAPKEIGTMGKFAVRQAGERMKLGGDGRGEFKDGKPKDEWRRDQPPHQALRQERHDRRPFNSRLDDEAEPAWMQDELGGDGDGRYQDPALMQLQDDSLVQFIPGEDRIAAHKRAMKGNREEQGRAPLVGFFGADAPDPVKAKPVKDYVAANYLLRNKEKVELGEVKESGSVKEAGSSRFQRFFGSPAQSNLLQASPSPGRFNAAPQAGVVLASGHANPSPDDLNKLRSVTTSSVPSSVRSPENAETSRQAKLVDLLGPSRSPVPKQPEYGIPPSGSPYSQNNSGDPGPNHAYNDIAYQPDTHYLAPSHATPAGPAHHLASSHVNNGQAFQYLPQFGRLPPPNDHQAGSHYQVGHSHALPPGLTHPQQYPPRYGAPPQPPQGYLPQHSYMTQPRPPPTGFLPGQQPHFQQQSQQHFQARPTMPGPDSPAHIRNMFAMLNSPRPPS